MTVYYKRVYVEDTSMSSLMVHINEIYKTYRLVSIMYNCDSYKYIAILEKER